MDGELERMTSSLTQDRVLVIGLDGATFDLIRPWLESGDLPHLSRLYHEGVRGILESVVPPLSPESWSTFMTGKHPGQHGVMNFIAMRPGSYDLSFNCGANVQERSLWRLLSDAGRRVGVIGVPMTYPPEAGERLPHFRPGDARLEYPLYLPGRLARDDAGGTGGLRHPRRHAAPLHSRSLPGTSARNDRQSGAGGVLSAGALPGGVVRARDRSDGPRAALFLAVLGPRASAL